MALKEKLRQAELKAKLDSLSPQPKRKQKGRTTQAKYLNFDLPTQESEHDYINIRLKDASPSKKGVPNIHDLVDTAENFSVGVEEAKKVTKFDGHELSQISDNCTPASEVARSKSVIQT